MQFREMHRKNQQLGEEETLAILEQQGTGVLSLNGEGGYPYGVPLNYVYKNGKVYVHGAIEGYKSDAISRDDRVSFCVIGEDKVVPHEFTDYYKSVILFGRARIIGNSEERDIIMRDFGKTFAPMESKAALDTEIKDGIERIVVIEITPEHITGKAATGVLAEEEEEKKAEEKADA